MNLTNEQQPETHDEHDQLLASHNVCDPLVQFLIVVSEVETKKPNMFGQTADIVRRALDIAAKAYRRGGCTSGQLQTIADLTSSLQGMLK